MGGLLNLWAIPNTGYNLLGKTLTITDPDNSYQLYFAKESLSIKEDSHTNKKMGLFYSLMVQGVIPSVTPENLAAILEIESKDYVILVQDANGVFKLAGTAYYPMQLVASMISGKLSSDRTGWDCKFIGNTISRFVEVDNPF